jgi:hypothetical protein
MKIQFPITTANESAIRCMHWVVLGVMLAQCRLVELDHVLHVVDLHVRQWLPESAVSDPLQLVIGYYLDQHKPAGRNTMLVRPAPCIPTITLAKFTSQANMNMTVLVSISPTYTSYPMIMAIFLPLHR